MSKNPYKEDLKDVLLERYGDDITFADPQDTSWAEKKSLAAFTFKPQPANNHNFDIDIAITPRCRQIDPVRNYKFWQSIVDELSSRGYRVAACGTAEESFDLNGLAVRSWDYIDVDSDVEIFNTSRVVITQDTGLAYLAMLCERPIIMIGPYDPSIIILHHPQDVPIRHIKPPEIVQKVVEATEELTKNILLSS